MKEKRYSLFNMVCYNCDDTGSDKNYLESNMKMMNTEIASKRRSKLKEQCSKFFFSFLTFCAKLFQLIIG